MKKNTPFCLFALIVLTVMTGLPADQEVLKPVPLTQIVTGRPGSVSASGTLKVPLITWGGDVATILAHDQGLFREEGLTTSLFLENTFPNQVKACFAGETPFLRGTMGMINAASELFSRNGLDLVVVCQLTWSTGGDALVTRRDIRSPAQLRGKTVALQLYGPHMDYLANILQNAGVPVGSVNYRWFRELSLPTTDTRGKIIDPVSAFLGDESIDAVMCIIPDAMNLTSGGRTGSGASGSVKGARIMLSTKTASRIIADVYAVRGDYYRSQPDKVKAFVRALMKGQEKLTALTVQGGQNTEYRKLLGHSADLLLGSPQAIPDIEALLGDCEFVGRNGQIGFFTGKGTTRTRARLTEEIQGSFIALGLLSGRATLRQADWDFADLTQGGISAPLIPEREQQRFDTRKVEEKISVESTSWAEEGTLFQIDITFAPNQSAFSEEQYADDFKKALEIAQTYGGALIIIEGHSDPLGILKARQANRAAVEIGQMEQQAKNLSLERSRAVRASFLKYCGRRSYKIDESQFVSVGLGITRPKFSPPRTKEEWDANRRVVFRIKQVEAELSEFSPIK